ncbi:unnamed protein product [Vitrella brassicaformis CCMP3155]|uniref:Uncharacterized protein n=2 Tax=Vitrella brassicaformis TaxID=1169539 RepID=A0A0G4F8S3_VITBC|nr:unnamed protein product [Vitrella brassicaformis CCMP3155]|eukprot:CEM08590.1 unnamed protein product [Vitrella brassicaformis CCMP3155]
MDVERDVDIDMEAAPQPRTGRKRPFESPPPEPSAFTNSPASSNYSCKRPRTSNEGSDGDVAMSGEHDGGQSSGSGSSSLGVRAMNASLRQMRLSFHPQAATAAAPNGITTSSAPFPSLPQPPAAEPPQPGMTSASASASVSASAVVGMDVSGGSGCGTRVCQLCEGRTVGGGGGGGGGMVRCTHCERVACGECGGVCEACRLPFCRLCTTLDYSSDFPLLFCLDCAARRCG